MRWIGIRARLDHDHSPPEVLISVQDRGLGISGSELAHIFEPFYRSPQVGACTDSRNRPGTPARPAYRRSHGRQPHGDKPGRSRIHFTLHLVCSPADRSRSEVSVASGESAANHEREYSAGGRRRRSAHTSAIAFTPKATWFNVLLTVEDGLDQATRLPLDLIILDVMLPGRTVSIFATTFGAPDWHPHPHAYRAQSNRRQSSRAEAGGR